MARNVLIVDDVAVVRKELGTLLKKYHYKVLGEASTGTEAIYLFKKLNPDVVLMDISLDEAQAGQLVNLTSFDAGGKVVVEVLQRLDRRKAGQPRQHALLSHTTSRRFGLQELLQEIAVGGILLGGLLRGDRVALGDKGQVQVLAQREHAFVLEVHAFISVTPRN